jgi:hypothetical protein
MDGGNMTDTERTQIHALIDEFLDYYELTLQKLANELCLVEQGILFTEQAVANWRYEKARPDALRMRTIARDGGHIGSEFAKRVLAIYGLKLLDE